MGSIPIRLRSSSTSDDAAQAVTAQSGATLAEVMRRAGHSSSAAAIRHQHAADRRGVEIAARLSAMARGGTSGTA